MNATDEMVEDNPIVSSLPDFPAPTGFPFAPAPLVTVSVEKNSRGYTWKVEVSDVGVPANEALATLDYMVNQMGSRYGYPTPDKKE
jgi:hypothetical protein